MKNKLHIASVVMIITSFFMANFANAALKLQNANEFIGTTAAQAGIQQGNIAGIAAAVIQAALGLVGIVFLVLIIYGGIRWMTASGNPDAVKNARKLIINAVIGLAIVTAAYSISYFIAAALEVKP